MTLIPTEQWKTEQTARKQELKGLANEIKTLKPEFKQSQRELSLSLREFNIEDNLNKHERRNPNILKMIRDIYIKKLHIMWGKQLKLSELRNDYRYKHLIYCLYNGTPEEKIEPNRDDYQFRIKMIYTPAITAARKVQMEWQEQKEMKIDKAILSLTEEPDYCNM